MWRRHCESAGAGGEDVPCRAAVCVWFGAWWGGGRSARFAEFARRFGAHVASCWDPKCESGALEPGRSGER